MTNAVGAGMHDPEVAPRPWLDHVGIAVWDLAAAAHLLTTGLGARFLRGGDHEGRGFRTAQFALAGEAKLELLTPLKGVDCELRSFLEARGQGVHHLTLMTHDVPRLAQHLGECGYNTTHESYADAGWREAYLVPRRSGLGTVVQVGDSVLDWSSPDPDSSLGTVLNARWVWQGARPVPADVVEQTQGEK